MYSLFSSPGRSARSKAGAARQFQRNAGLLLGCILAFFAASGQDDAWITFTPEPGKDRQKRIVLIAGDEAYRSEESLPMLGRLLARQGFTATVLFAINPGTGNIDPDCLYNIPGLEALASADLMLIATRFRELPDGQMRYIDDYLNRGKPVIGLRTATHAFNYKQNPRSRYVKYSFNSKEEGWAGGFGKRILGETWVSHHGANGKEGTRGLIDGIASGSGHPVLRGVNNVWGITDVYGIRKLPPDYQVLVWGQPVQGLREDSPAVRQKSVMPVAWTGVYVADSGKRGRVFTTTMGASADFLNEGLRRLVVNAAYWAMGMDVPEITVADLDISPMYRPTMFGFGGYIKAKKPADYK